MPGSWENDFLSSEKNSQGTNLPSIQPRLSPLRVRVVDGAEVDGTRWGICSGRAACLSVHRKPGRMRRGSCIQEAALLSLPARKGPIVKSSRAVLFLSEGAVYPCFVCNLRLLADAPPTAGCGPRICPHEPRCFPDSGSLSHCGKQSFAAIWTGLKVAAVALRSAPAALQHATEMHLNIPASSREDD